MCTNSSVLPTLPEGAEEDLHGVPSDSAIISKLKGHADATSTSILANKVQAEATAEAGPPVLTFNMDDDATAPEIVEPAVAAGSSKVASRTSSAGSAFGGAEKGSIMDKGPRISQASTAASTQLSVNSEVCTASVQTRIEQEIAKQIQAVSHVLDAKHQEAQMEVEALMKKNEELQRQAEQLPRLRRRSSTSSTTTPSRPSLTNSNTTPRQSASWAPPLAPMTPRDSEQKHSTQACTTSPLQTKQRRHTMTQSTPRTSSAAQRALRRSSVGGRLELRGADLETHRQWMMEQRQNLLEDLYPDTNAFPPTRLSLAAPGMTLKSAPAA